MPERLPGNWDIFLNVLAEDRLMEYDFRREFYGEPENGSVYDTTVSSLYIQVLRPLCWTDLLHEQSRDEPGFYFTRTPLWRAALRLDTDDMVQPSVRH